MLFIIPELNCFNLIVIFYEEQNNGNTNTNCAKSMKSIIASLISNYQNKISNTYVHADKLIEDLNEKNKGNQAKH